MVKRERYPVTSKNIRSTTRLFWNKKNTSLERLAGLKAELLFLRYLLPISSSKLGYLPILRIFVALPSKLYSLSLRFMDVEFLSAQYGAGKDAADQVHSWRSSKHFVMVDAIFLSIFLGGQLCFARSVGLGLEDMFVGKHTISGWYVLFNTVWCTWMQTLELI